jgi:hypothetical protein
LLFSKAFYSALLDIRSRRKRRELSFEPANSELVEGFHVKTQLSSNLLTNDEEPVVVSLMGDLYIELELEEAVAFAQRREEYLTVWARQSSQYLKSTTEALCRSLLAIKDRITGMKAELEMDDNSFKDLLKQFQMATS